MDRVRYVPLSRVVYRVLADLLDPQDYGQSWQIPPSCGAPKVIALAANAWSLETETELLDIGWTEVLLSPDGMRTNKSKYLWWDNLLTLKDKTQRGVSSRTCVSLRVL